MNDRSIRSWIWASLALQLAGYAWDAVWHGLLNPGAEPQTRAEMARHLATVHLPLYIGAASVLAWTSWALLRAAGRSAAGIALPVAFTGALVSVIGEAWHAYAHLQMSTASGPIAGSLSFVGFVIIVGAMWAGRGRRRHAMDTTNEGRRAA
jgi:hypothetical protein